MSSKVKGWSVVAVGGGSIVNAAVIYNYLHGAHTRYDIKIFSGSKVDRIARMPDGSLLLTVIESKTGMEGTFSARVVVVAAGSLGSSELLLRQKNVHGTPARPLKAPRSPVHDQRSACRISINDSGRST